MSATSIPAGDGRHQVIPASPSARSDRRRPPLPPQGAAGFIKRFENFDALRSKVRRWRGTATPKLYILDIITWLPQLTASEKDYMRVEVSLISPEDLQTGAGGLSTKLNSYSAQRASRCVGSVKRTRRTLEAKGFLLRHTDGDNNSTKTDIRPFLVDIDTYREAYEAEFNARRARFDQANQFDTIDDEMSPRGDTADTHIQSPQTACNAVPLAEASDAASAWSAEKSIQDAESGLSPDNLTQRQQCSEPRAARSNVASRNCSPGGARTSFGASRIRPGQAQTARGALTEAYRHSNSLASYIAQADIDSLDLPALYAGCERAVSELLPERNTVHTWRWAVRNHAWGAIIRLIVALDDPNVRDRYGVLGALAKPEASGIAVNDGFRSNFARMTRRRDDPMAPIGAETATGGADPARPASAEPCDTGELAPAAAQWPAFLAALAAQLGAAPFRTMLAGLALVDYTPGLCLRLSVPHASSIPWASGRRQAFDLAAKAVGWRFDRFDIRARS